MPEYEPGCVQKLPFEPEIARPAVQRVPGDRQVDGREVHADLMRPARLERDPQQGVPRQELLHLEMRHRLARRISVERLPERVVPVAPHGSVDRPFPRARPSGDKRDVLPGEPARLHELLQQANPSGAYGPYAFGLSAYSNVLYSFGGGPGQIGLQGTNEPGALGTNVSHGCIRISNSGISRLARILPLGTPVQITR